MEMTEYGICRLALVPVRTAPTDPSIQVTQLLFGDHYEVSALSEDRRWMQITVASDQSQGWIDHGHHHMITREYFDQVNHADFKITTDITATLLYKKSALTILMGSIVPISTSELFKMEEQLAFNGESKSLRDGEFAKSIALKYINSPYQAGGRSPFGIDCGGLIQMVYRISGFNVPRDLHRLSTLGKKIASPEEALCGDLAFFQGHVGSIIHAGIVLDEEKIIHVDGRVRIDHLNEEGILQAETKLYTHELVAIRRVI
jgi:gamma-D-glutamyl-L-lysine dipeptidyl-peptidase